MANFVTVNFPLLLNFLRTINVKQPHILPLLQTDVRRWLFIINKLKMRKDLEHLTKEQKEYLAKKIFKKISSGSYSIYAESEQCFNRIKSALEIKDEKNTHKK